ncbi:monovalent cation/H+ antiporter complex subunit F [Tabrizicola sp. J26]|uniref:monovalent cation/H+ antiporter complex subunit F n=1 Tax=Alitabrizicola rongguiensis TaxID=2909234 RepID=UPI001F3C0630|nr:monovalent cation/H+ antiporter complex subunit F [Tabrizicola rongguiensis]MCF1710891.1 monovalent cation/H+ antiporter complex subunit F [Tabrizicola rongguiensis]
MAEFLFAAAAIVLVLTGLGLARMLWGPSPADRMMAAQLLGTGGGAIAVLVAIAGDMTAVLDIALTLALLAAFAAVALTLGEPGSKRRGGEE